MHLFCAVNAKEKNDLVLVNHWDQIRYTTDICDARTSTQAYSNRTEMVLKDKSTIFQVLKQQSRAQIILIVLL